jgi:hypothetical protein
VPFRLSLVIDVTSPSLDWFEGRQMVYPSHGEPQVDVLASMPICIHQANVEHNLYQLCTCGAEQGQKARWEDWTS